MTVINCPLCCRQTFKSVLALREHLLYFTYRPLACMFCGLSTNGIYELTRHLESHLTAVKSIHSDQANPLLYGESDIVCRFTKANEDDHKVTCNITKVHDSNYTEPVCLKKSAKFPILPNKFASEKNLNIECENDMLHSYNKTQPQALHDLFPIQPSPVPEFLQNNQIAEEDSSTSPDYIGSSCYDECSSSCDTQLTEDHQSFPMMISSEFSCERKKSPVVENVSNLPRWVDEHNRTTKILQSGREQLSLKSASTSKNIHSYKEIPKNMFLESSQTNLHCDENNRKEISLRDNLLEDQNLSKEIMLLRDKMFAENQYSRTLYQKSFLQNITERVIHENEIPQDFSMSTEKISPEKVSSELEIGQVNVLGSANDTSRSKILDHATQLGDGDCIKMNIVQRVSSQRNLTEGSKNLNVSTVSSRIDLPEDKSKTSAHSLFCNECGIDFVDKRTYLEHKQSNCPIHKEQVNIQNHASACKAETNSLSSQQLKVISQEHLIAAEGISHANQDGSIKNKNSRSIGSSNSANKCEVISEIQSAKKLPMEVVASGLKSDIRKNVQTTKSKSSINVRNMKSKTWDGNQRKQKQSTVPIVTSKSTQPYIHKKFDHDQGRKQEMEIVPKIDVNCYIQNFQSFLVDKLNKASEHNEGYWSVRKALDEEKNVKNSSLTSSLSKSVDKIYNKISQSAKKDDQDAPSKHNLQCSNCCQRFSNHKNFNTHLEANICRLYTCKICSKSFNRLYLLRRHKGSVHSDMTFYCNLCGKHFKTTLSLENHRTLHEKRKFRCSKCSYMCHTSSGLRTHVSEKHPSNQSKVNIHSCEVCGQKFKKKYGLKRHIERIHKKATLLCKYCDKGYRCSEDLTNHLNTHLDTKTFTCEVCSSIFTTTSSLRRHKAKHEPLSKTNTFYDCEICSAKFTRKDSLSVHVRTVHKSFKPYVCHCGKAFSKKSLLKYHSAKHSRETNFSCKFCKKNFRLRQSLQSHECKSKSLTTSKIKIEEQ